MSTRKETPHKAASGPNGGRALGGAQADGTENQPAMPLHAAASHRHERLSIVGVGGSAGGIEALQGFFAAMPADSGMAFVVILHLSAEHESNLAALLQHATAMPVRQVHGAERIEPDHVYVIPPGKALLAVDDRLQLTNLPPNRGKQVAIDLFFRTLADTHGSRAAAVVLSGADDDGAIGIKRIKERGGLTIAQEPSEALHAHMPRAAVTTGMVDWVLPVGAMPGRLLEYRRLAQQLRLPPEDGPQPATRPSSNLEDETALRDVLAFLRTRTRRDFACYKRATIVRRVARRMQVNGVADMQSYLGFLRASPGEAMALLQDLLISVTNFFRDSECFAALEARIPQLFRGKSAGDSVRVWVPACATGEEAYSISMLLHEHARTLETPIPIQVFATDLDDEVIRRGREAIYPSTIGADVSEERLRIYFTREHRGYRVRPEIRESVLFAVHDLLKDPPFSRLDLVSCRNLLIYLNRDAQARAFELFNFALRGEGLLFLGTSEGNEESGSLFATVDKKNRLFSRRPVPRALVALGDGLSLPMLNIGHDATARVAAARDIDTTAWSSPARAATGGHGSGWSALHYKLIEHLASPSLVVDAKHDIVHLSERAGRYLQFAGGEMSNNLLRAVRPALRIELRAALSRSTQSGAKAEALAVPVEIDGKATVVDMTVIPAGDVAPDFQLVLFRERTSEGDTAPDNTGSESPQADVLAQDLDRELARLQAHLRETIEQYEGSTEELKASNEELQAMNEELRSATEELETSREELRSINEELTTVNSELKGKVDELGRSNSDLHNLMGATAIATVFLDRDLKITRYTPSAVGVFNFIPADIGRPLSDVTHRLHYGGLTTDAARVLGDLIPVEREVSSSDGQWYWARILPYRTIEDRIGGVVLTFVDITVRKRTEMALAESRAEMGRQSRLFDTAQSSLPDNVVTFNRDKRLIYANRGLETLFGLPNDRMIGRRLAEIQEGSALAQRLDAQIQHVLDHKAAASGDEQRLTPDGLLYFEYTLAPVVSEEDGVESVVGWFRDVTARREAEQALRDSEERYRSLFEAIDEAFCVVEAPADDTRQALDFRIVQTNPVFEQHTGLHDANGQWLRTLYPGLDAYWFDMLAAVARTGQPVRFERQVQGLGARWFDVSAFRVGLPEDRQVGVLLRNVSARKRTERNLEFLAALNVEFARLSDPDDIIAAVGEAIRAHFGFAALAFWDINEEEVTATIAWSSGVVPEDVVGCPQPLADFLDPKHIECLFEGDIVALEDVQAGRSGVPTHGSAYRPFAVRSILAAPYVSEGHWKTLLVGARTDASAWLPDEIALLGELSTRISLRVERARAEHAISQDLADTRLLQDLGTRLVGAGNVQVLYDEITAAAITLLHADAGTMQLLNREREELVLLSMHGLPPSFAESFGRIDAGSLTSSGRALQARERSIVDFDVATPDPDDMQRMHIAAGHASAQSTPLITRSGEVIGMLSTHWRTHRRPSERDLRFLDLLARQAADLIERRLAVEALQASEERLRLVVENAREYAIFSTDLERRVTSWNVGAERIMGYAEAEILGKTFDLIFSEEDRRQGVPEQEVRQALQHGRAANGRWHQRKDGVLFWASGVLMAMRNPEGEMVGLVSIFRDQTAEREAVEAVEKSRTELLRALEETRHARQELEIAAQAKDRFLAVLSHELRTPLSPVLMAVQMLWRRSDLPDYARSALSMIRRNVRVESLLIDDLLDLTRISRGKLEIARETIDLHEALRGVIEICESDIESKNQQLTVAMDAQQHVIHGDFNRLQQAVWNVVKNAAKFTPPAGRIVITTRNVDDRVIVTVEDNGIGIEPAAMPHIFEAFHQGSDWVAHKYGGLGLGLSIAKATVDAHGGSLRVESDGPDRGARFIMELPLN